MSRKLFRDSMLNIAGEIAKRSTCARSSGAKQRGAIAIDEFDCMVSVGFNGVPRGFPHCTEAPCKGAKQPSGGSASDDCMAVHAEINCIINSHSPKSIHKMYLTHSPCFKCALALVNLVNLKEIYYLEEYGDTRGIEILRESNIQIYTFNTDGTLRPVN